MSGKPSAAGSGGRRSALVLDPKLLPRVLAYLNANEGANGGDARIREEDIVDHLRSKHPEYSRRPYAALLKQVSRLCEQQRERAVAQAAAAGEAGGGGGGGGGGEVGAQADDSDRAMAVDDDDEEDDDVEVIEREDRNLVNSSMRALYATPTKGQPASAAVTSPAAASASALSAAAPATVSIATASEQVQSISAPSSVNPKKRKKYRATLTSALSAASSASPSPSSDTWQPTFVTPQLSYSDLGGLSSTLQDLRELIHYPLLHPELYSHLGISPPAGVLLHGPAGCGQSRAVAVSVCAPRLCLSGDKCIAY